MLEEQIKLNATKQTETDLKEKLTIARSTWIKHRHNLSGSSLKASVLCL